MIALYLSKQKALDTVPKAILQINFTGNVDQARKTIMFFIIEEAKEPFGSFTRKSQKKCNYILI